MARAKEAKEAKEDRNLPRWNNPTWMAAVGAVAALGAIVLFIAAQPAAVSKADAQKPTAPKPVAQRPTAQNPPVQDAAVQNLVAQKSATKSTESSNPSVTVSGCLQADGKAFKLTDVKGPQAPKGRSWKTGFIKKTTKNNVEVVSASSNVKLMDHVGRQVTVVGVTADDDQIKATSIKRMAASCS